MKKNKPSRLNAGLKGVKQRFGGYCNRVVNLPLWRGSSMQVCGLFPFACGAGSPMVGAPLGRHLFTNAAVCCDPISWFEDGKFISNPSMFILGNPGLGKSSTIRHMAIGMNYAGVLPLVLGDTKPDYVDLIEALDGQVINIGEGVDVLNPLDVGDIQPVIDNLDASERTNFITSTRSHQVSVLLALIELVRREKVSDREETIIAEAIDIWCETNSSPPVISNILDILRSHPARLDSIALARGDMGRYQEVTENLEASLTALTKGRWGALFGRQTSTPMKLDRPVCFDVSALDLAPSAIQGAVLLVCWAYGFAQVRLANMIEDKLGGQPRRYFLVLDELWRILRAGAGMVDRIDEITRLNRARGVGQVMATHTVSDLDAINNAEDRAKAHGFISRSGMVALAGLSQTEVAKVNEILPLSKKEQNLLISWQTPPSWQNSSDSIPPGVGKILLKVASRPAIPVEVVLSKTEISLNDTNKRWASSTTRKPHE